MNGLIRQIAGAGLLAILGTPPHLHPTITTSTISHSLHLLFPTYHLTISQEASQTSFPSQFISIPIYFSPPIYYSPTPHTIHSPNSQTLVHVKIFRFYLSKAKITAPKREVYPTTHTPHAHHPTPTLLPPSSPHPLLLRVI